MVSRTGARGIARQDVALLGTVSGPACARQGLYGDWVLRGGPSIARSEL